MFVPGETNPETGTPNGFEAYQPPGMAGGANAVDARHDSYVPSETVDSDKMNGTNPRRASLLVEAALEQASNRGCQPQ